MKTTVAESNPDMGLKTNKQTFGARDVQTCSYCNDVIGYIEHFFFDCPTIQKFWNYIKQYILITFDIQTHLYLTVLDVLFQIKQHICGRVKTKRINHYYINRENVYK